MHTCASERDTMTTPILLAGLTAAALLVYLIVALLRPERF
jgi:K+-transporting ATPase KdpF subunit